MTFYFESILFLISYLYIFNVLRSAFLIEIYIECEYTKKYWKIQEEEWERDTRAGV